MTHPLVRRLAPLMDGDVTRLRAIVAETVLETPCDRERAVLRYFGAELGAVQRRIRCRAVPPTREEIEIALTVVLALMNRRACTCSTDVPSDTSLLSLGGELSFGRSSQDLDEEQLPS